MKKWVPVIMVAAAAIAGCSSSTSSSSSGSSGAAASAPSFNQVPDLPIPNGARMDIDRTLLLGQGQNWVGRLSYSVRWTSPASLYDFFKAQMPSFGWQEVTSVRGEVSLQTWQKTGRVCSIQIEDTTLGSEATITMSPASGGSVDTGSGSQSIYQPPPPSPSPMPPAVTAQPLK